MMKMHLKYIYFLFGLLFFLSTTTKAQENNPSTSLITFIQQLENTYAVKFSYVDEDINGIQIKAPQKQSFAAILDNLQKQTGLKIEKLNERYYTFTKTTTIDICGIVLDNFKQNTIAGATIMILGTDIAKITRLDGSFSLNNVPRNANIQIQHIGFKTLFIPAEKLISKNPCKKLLLAQFHQKLEEVIVYDFLTRGLIKNTDASIDLNTDVFGILPGLTEPDILQTVQALPGVESIDETVSNINIRGGSNDQNLILWDGIKMYQSGHFFGLISAFNPHLTDKVTLIKNGTSARYGDGVSGIIDINTKNKIVDTFFGGAGFNLISGDLYGQIPLSNKIAFQFSGRRSLTDFFNTPTFTQFFNRVFRDDQVTGGSNKIQDIQRDDTFYFYDFTAKLLYDINTNQKVRLSVINTSNILDYSESSANGQRETESALDQTNFSFGGSLESTWNDIFSTYVNLYYSRYNLDSENNDAINTQVLFQNNLIEETSLLFKTNFQLNENLNWVNGYQLSDTGITNKTELTQPPFVRDIKGIITTQALFSELNYESTNKKLFARAGVRVNYYSNRRNFDELIIEPRLNINYKIVEGIHATAMGEFKSQATHQIIDLEQNFLGIEKRRWVVANETLKNLPIAKSKQGSIGLSYERKNLYIGFEGFYKQVNDISTATQGFQNENQFNDELGKYDVKGVEFLINKKTTNYSIWASYTFNSNNYTFTFDANVPQSFPNNFDIRHALNFGGIYTYNNFKIGLGLNYRSGKPFTEPDVDNPIDDTFFPGRINYASPNSSRLPDYLRADASIIYDFNINSGIKASVGASVLNFTSKNNILNTYFRLNDANEIETVESVSLGITPNLSFRVKF